MKYFQEMREELNHLNEKLESLEKIPMDLETMNRMKHLIDSLERKIKNREMDVNKLDSEIELYRKSVSDFKMLVHETSLNLQLHLAKGHIDIQRLLVSKENIKVK